MGHVHRQKISFKKINRRSSGLNIKIKPINRKKKIKIKPYI